MQGISRDHQKRCPFGRPFTDCTITGLTAALAQEEGFVFLESTRIDKENHHSFLFLRPRQWLCCYRGDDPADYLGRLDAFREQGGWVAGWFSYEFGYLLEPVLRPLAFSRDKLPAMLACFGLFEQPLIHDHRTAAQPRNWPCSAGQPEHTPVTPVHVQPAISREQYLTAIGSIKNHIARGATYQVNYTFPLHFQYGGSPASLYCLLRRNQSVGYSGWIRYQGLDIMSFSPELFFEAVPGRVRTRPMKGTRKRGHDLEQDHQEATFLREDGKNRAENVMIVDLLRNDLGRLLHGHGGGRVQVDALFSIETYETLLQMTSSVQGHFADSRFMPTLGQLIPALFPCGSVTGAPKIETMKIIAALEQQPRSVYCGAIGYGTRERLVFNVPIRTLELRKGHGRMGVGGGIVADSVAEQEFAEGLLKGRFLTHPKPRFQLIETMRWQPGQGYLFLEDHLARLLQSASYFLFVCDIDTIRNNLTQRADGWSHTPMRVRLLLARDGRVKITSAPLPETASVALTVQQAARLPAVKMALATTSTDPADCFLYHKTTHRPLYARYRAQAESRGWFDLVFTNTRGQLTEGTITNLFVRRGDVLLTPPRQAGLLAGTLRHRLIKQGQAREHELYPDDLKENNGIFLGNAVRGLVPVQLVCG